jgi:hypothetical protein
MRADMTDGARLRVDLLVVFTLLSIGLTGTVVHGQGSGQTPDPSAGTRPGRVVVYPLLVQTPLFGATLDLPALPGGGGEGGDHSGSTDVSLNTAYLVGFLVETNRLFVEASGTWADISADRELPHASLKTRTLLFTARGGVRVFKGISVTGGVHHLGMELDAALELPQLGRTIEGSAKPGYWDPMLGVDWRGRYGRWALQTSFEGGGFGVGTDVNLSGEARVDYRIGWFDLRFGYSISHIEATVLDVNIGQFQRELVVRQTLHGPNIGVGIAF